MDMPKRSNSPNKSSGGNLNQVSDCAVMGDDWPDLAMMKNAGFRICPAQAHEAVKASAHYVTTRAGGNSAVREVCDLILKAQNRYEALLNKARQ